MLSDLPTSYSFKIAKERQKHQELISEFLK